MKLIKSILVVAFVALSSFASAQQKFGVINAQDVLMKMPEMDSVKIKMEKIQQSLVSDMEATEREYTKKVQDFQKNAATYSPTIREQKEKDIQSIVTRMQEFEQVAQREMQEQQQLLMAPVQKRLLEAINQVGKENACVFVFDKNSALYVSETLTVDVTALVMTQLGIK